MTNSHLTETNPTSEVRPKRSSRLLITGSILWSLCLVGMAYTIFQWRERVLSSRPPTAVTEAVADDGRNPKQIKLVPQKDGTFAAVEILPGADDSPWDADGIEDFSFTDSNGQSITKKDLIGKPFIIAFVFTLCRGPCPNVTLQMQELQDRLKDYDFNLVTLTVDPERDTIEKLNQYGKDHHANFDRWKFVTGDQKDIYGLIQRSFKMPVEESKGADRKPGFEIIHSTNIMLVNSEGRVIGKFNAQKEEEMARLRKELKEIAKPKRNDAATTSEGQK